MALDSKRRSRQDETARIGVYALCVGLLLMAAGSAQAQVVAGSSLYVRQDTDRTTVIAPRLHVGAPVTDSTRVDLVYTADVWTSASIDIRSSASKPVTEQRDEINTTLTQDWNDFSLSGTYRYSHEYDYESHGGSLSGTYSFADKAAQLEFRLSATFDQVGRAGDPHFNQHVRNLAGRIGFTQLINTQGFIQIAYELMNAHGFNSSAYRFVSIGSSNGLCGVGDVRVASVMTTMPSEQYCIPETLPDDRLRHAFAPSLRYALTEQFSLGLGYRFYLDSWDVMSHTGIADLSFLADRLLMFSLRYRFYLQNDSKWYKKRYDFSDQTLGYYTNDKELSAFMSHRVALDIEKGFELDERGHVLTVVLSFAPSFFMYSNYAPLTQITAFESTLSTVFKL
jgi:hypothetical protein